MKWLKVPFSVIKNSLELDSLVFSSLLFATFVTLGSYSTFRISRVFVVWFCICKGRVEIVSFIGHRLSEESERRSLWILRASHVLNVHWLIVIAVDYKVGRCESNFKSGFSTTPHCLLRLRLKIAYSQEKDYFLTNLPLAVVCSGRKEFYCFLLFLIFTIFLIEERSI